MRVSRGIVCPQLPVLSITCVVIDLPPHVPCCGAVGQVTYVLPDIIMVVANISGSPTSE